VNYPPPCREVPVMPAFDRRRGWLGLAKIASELLSPTRGSSRADVGEPSSLGAIVQLHVAEYEALMTRITYWILIQYSVGGAIAVSLLSFFLGQPQFPAVSGIKIWTIVVTTEIFFGAYYYSLFEMMTHSDYIENTLVKRLRDLKYFQGKEFWEYERHRKRNRVYSPSGMYVAMIFCIAPPYVALLFLRPPHREIVDLVFAPLSMIFASVAFFIARSAVQTQQRFAS
jgi:hypothetical protein